VESSPRGRYRDALRVRDFRLLAISSLVDGVGGWSYNVVIAVDVYQRTHSTTWLAVLSGARWVTGLGLSATAGTLADRYERTRVMLVSALLSAVVMSGLALCVGLRTPVWTLVALTVLSAAVATPYAPAAGALTPEVVEEKDLSAANSIFATLENLVVVLGPAIGGLLLLAGPTVIGVILNAASFLIAALIVLRLRVRSRGEIDADESRLDQWLAGFRALGSHPIALALVAFCALDSMVYGASTVLYAPLSVHLGTGVDGYGYLLAGNAVGGVIAAGLANRLSALNQLAPVIGVSIGLQALPIAATNWVHSATPGFLLQVVSGIGMIIVDVLAITALQRDLDGKVMSRVLGSFEAIVLAAVLLASFVSAAIVASAGLAVTLYVIGFGIPGLALFGLPLLIRGDRLSIASAARWRSSVEVLGGLDVFAGATRPVLERLAKAAEERPVAAGEVIITEGEPADALWVLLRGSLAIRAAGPDGTEQVLPTVTAPGYVGELGLVRRVARTATVTAAEDAELLRIDGATFLDALETSAPSSSFLQLTGARWARTAGRPSE
jgi:Major Facilitator Superfamily/Cyclic nucleotide-binding domain